MWSRSSTGGSWNGAGSPRARLFSCGWRTWKCWSADGERGRPDHRRCRTRHTPVPIQGTANPRPLAGGVASVAVARRDEADGCQMQAAIPGLSWKQPVNLRPLLRRIVVVRPVDLPAGATRPMPVRGTPAENRFMGRPHVAERATMDGHGRYPSGQRGCHHAASERAWPVEQDADLHVRHAVEVEHDVAASPVDPARMQAVPDLAKELPP